ncbi:MAG: hypothetical protein AAGA65_16205 [Actinomycetota bacterium]
MTRLIGLLKKPYIAFRDRDRNLSKYAELTPQQEMEQVKQYRRPHGPAGR